MYTIKEENLAIDALKNNPLGDPYVRNIITVENMVNDRTPVFIGLPGFFGSGNSFLNKNYTSLDFMDVLTKLQNDFSFIIVLPDTMTRFGGNQFVDSSAVGNYETYITRDLMQYIKSKYGGRDVFLFGKSSGGFGSISLTLDHPELYAGFIDISGDSYFPYCYMPDFSTAYMEIRESGIDSFIDLYRKGYAHTQNQITAYNVIAMAAFYSPDKTSIKLPFSSETGELIPEVWERWLKFDPVNRLAGEINRLKGKKIILQTGNHDEFRINIGMNIIHDKLKKSNMEHIYREYPAGHFNTNYFYLDSFPEILRNYK
ncbi:alpha/beta hydrolase-fold protein [Ferroplasma sp.]|uniref:alpha/beta hydrolase-fold protein n=1 Tax=Ferroplasma sp. TaxID=2591003 RepID=UPI00260463F8|nr:alpha/beta hydrolase-fold protein [Ferroplasma sp.]MCL4453818.1 esterase family protein [Candidatus Thermoplasmatota archaeon]